MEPLRATFGSRAWEWSRSMKQIIPSDVGWLGSAKSIEPSHPTSTASLPQTEIGRGSSGGTRRGHRRRWRSGLGRSRSGCGAGGPAELAARHGEAARAEAVGVESEHRWRPSTAGERSERSSGRRPSSAQRGGAGATSAAAKLGASAAPGGGGAPAAAELGARQEGWERGGWGELSCAACRRGSSHG